MIYAKDTLALLHDDFQTHPGREIVNVGGSRNAVVRIVPTPTVDRTPENPEIDRVDVGAIRERVVVVAEIHTHAAGQDSVNRHLIDSGFSLVPQTLAVQSHRAIEYEDIRTLTEGDVDASSNLAAAIGEQH
jgi:hypothetical protein